MAEEQNSGCSPEIVFFLCACGFMQLVQKKDLKAPANPYSQVKKVLE